MSVFEDTDTNNNSKPLVVTVNGRRVKDFWWDSNFDLAVVWEDDTTHLFENPRLSDLTSNWPDY